MKKYLTLVLAVVAALTACDNGADAPQDERARIRIGAVSGGVRHARRDEYALGSADRARLGGRGVVRPLRNGFG
jgi:hypothetical protein